MRKVHKYLHTKYKSTYICMYVQRSRYYGYQQERELNDLKLTLNAEINS